MRAAAVAARGPAPSSITAAAARPCYDVHLSERPLLVFGAGRSGWTLNRYVTALQMTPRAVKRQSAGRAHIGAPRLSLREGRGVEGYPWSERGEVHARMRAYCGWGSRRRTGLEVK